MKGFLISAVLCFLLSPVLRAVDDRPPIPVEVIDESSGGVASHMAFAVREKMRASRTFKIVGKDVPRYCLLINTMHVGGAPNILIYSLVWVYEWPNQITARYLTSEIFTIGEAKQMQAVDGILASTEEVILKALNGTDNSR